MIDSTDVSIWLFVWDQQQMNQTPLDGYAHVQILIICCLWPYQIRLNHFCYSNVNLAYTKISWSRSSNVGNWIFSMDIEFAEGFFLLLRLHIHHEIWWLCMKSVENWAIIICEQLFELRRIGCFRDFNHHLNHLLKLMKYMKRV